MAWTDGMATEDVAYVQNKGWHTLPDADAAKTIVKTYRELETYKGAPPERLITLPAEDTPEAWKPVYTKLGVPDKPEGYTDITGEDADHLRGLAHAAGLTPRQAKAFAENYRANQAATKAAADAAATTKASQEAAERVGKETQMRGTNTAALQAEWKGEFEVKRLAAERMAGMLGYSADDLSAMAGTDKYVKFMGQMARMAAAGGELHMVDPGTGGGGASGGRTLEQLQARKEEIMKKARTTMATGEQTENNLKELAEIAKEELALKYGRR